MREATTPPPSSRLRTPPTPFHGAGYHTYEPFSPRRSARVSAPKPNCPLATSLPRLSHSHTPQPLRKSTLLRTSSSQTLSPPPSPTAASSSHRAHEQQTPVRSTPVRRSLFTKNRPAGNVLFASDLIQQPSPVSALPTPNKTPRKQDNNMVFKPTARALDFKSVMPSPHRRPKSRLTLDDDDDAAQSDIQFYTDVQDRVPGLDKTEENPFVGPRQKPKTRSSSSKPAKRIATEDECRDDDGIMYVFRGKKVFRRFASPTEHEDTDASAASNESIKRKAGPVAARPLTRSEFKPRLLFAPAKADQDSEHEAEHETDEEALTDIEEHNMPSSASASFKSITADTFTPAKQPSLHPATPPSSHRQTRSASKQLAIFADPTANMSDSDDAASDAYIAAPTPHKAKAKSANLFASWSRTKGSASSSAVKGSASSSAVKGSASSSAAKGTKRSLESVPEHEELPNKRARTSVPKADHT